MCIRKKTILQDSLLVGMAVQSRVGRGSLGLTKVCKEKKAVHGHSGLLLFVFSAQTANDMVRVKITAPGQGPTAR